jgi:hypothetical protein
MTWLRYLASSLMLLGFVAGQQAAHAAETAGAANCKAFKIDDKASKALQQVAVPPTKRCAFRQSRGFPLPDPACTPGAFNPTLTAEVLQNPEFRTSCVRSQTTTEEDKTKTYAWYATPPPQSNSGVMQTCELDHLISLELGGADTLDNIWPQCGPPGVVLVERYFKEKDTVENYLAKQVKEGALDLTEVQKGIASDWTQYLADAKKMCPQGKCR